MWGRCIDPLGSRLSVKLMHWTTPHLTLTEQLAAFLDDCRNLLKELDFAERNVLEGRQEATGHLIVSAPAFFVFQLGAACAGSRRRQSGISEFPAIWRPRYRSHAGRSFDLHALSSPGKVLGKRLFCRVYNRFHKPLKVNQFWCTIPGVIHDALHAPASRSNSNANYG
jgi:hypothetical protein